jgi:FKBP-type peptidyl-prolyl cis-trans isomerase FklB
MNKTFLVVMAMFLVSSLGFSQKKKDLIAEVAQLKAKMAKMQADSEVNLDDDLQKFSYAFGVGMGNNLKNMGVDSLSYNSFAVAMEDIMMQKEKMTIEEAQGLVKSILAEKQEAIVKAQTAEGEKFLAENGKKTGVTTTASGLQYEVITKGEGAMPTSTDKVKVHYTGRFLDGKVFDSSVERGEPIVFGVGGVIKGWTEALLLMPLGSKWNLFIPQDLAYGPRGAGGGEIPPYATLMFEVELLAIEQ